MNFFRRLMLLASVTAMLGIMTLPVLAASFYATPISEDEYWLLAQSTHDVISQLNELSNEEVQQNLIALANQWEVITEVNAAGQIIPIDNGYLIKLMRADQPDLEEIDRLLLALLDAHQTYPSQVFSTSTLPSLHEILSRPEFQWAEPALNPINEWLQKIWDVVNRWLNDLLGDFAQYIPSNTTWLMVILLVAIVFFVFRTLFVDFIKEAQLNGEESGENEPLTSEAAFNKAQSLSRGGDYRSAVRYLYLSSLLLMDERGVLRYDRSKTNREYLRSVANSPELAKPLEEVIEVFDNVWYGYHSLEEETFKHYSDRVEELKDKKS